VRVIKSCALLVINFYFFIDSKRAASNFAFFLTLALPSNNVLSDLQIVFEKRAGGEERGRIFASERCGAKKTGEEIAPLFLSAHCGNDWSDCCWKFH
jgi:hypothetical protein